jgi:CheY-like chemotaxis protein/nitrogen-specific signal transduction histidine kinase
MEADERLRVENEDLAGRDAERAELYARLQRLEQVTRAKDELLSVVSHELRTPLNVVQGWLWQLKRRGDDAAIRSRAIAVIERNLAVQMRLVEDLLDASRAAAGKLYLRKRLVELTSVCRSIVDASYQAAQDKELTLVFTEPDAPAFVSGDCERLQQTISNILSNSIKFTPRGGVIYVSLDRVGPRARVQVRDTGLGIPRESLPSIFEPFAQADRTSTRQFGGLGLGLAIVKQIVTLHGGTISAHSDGENRGTTIVMELPIPAVLEEPDRWSEAAADVEPPRRELAGVKILVVDDEPDACEVVRRILEHQSASVRTAGCASEALRVLPELEPDVLLIDLAMPETDGYELLRRIRRLPRGTAVPAVALSAYGSSAEEAALKAGFNQYRTKPIAPDELVSLIARLAIATRD